MALARLLGDLDRLSRDRTRGATALGRDAVRALARAFRDPTAPVWSAADVRRGAAALLRAQPAMGAFRARSAELAALAGGRDTPVAGRRLRAWASRSQRRYAGETGRAVRVAAREFPPTGRVVTISRSDTVLRLLAHLPASRRPGEVVVLRSLPGGEGAELARQLRRAGLRARVVPDGDAVGAVREADLVLLGADAVFADGTLFHKVGTRRLVAAARAQHVPVAVITGSSKIVPTKAPSRAPGARFDRTPGGWISVTWTDRGRYAPGRRTGPARAAGARAGRRTTPGARGRARRRGA